jgi:two-component system response regulator PilR (NtrC family)
MPPLDVEQRSLAAVAEPGIAGAGEAIAQEPLAGEESLDACLAAYEKRVLLLALEQAGGVKKAAATRLGITYRSYRHRLEKYGLSSPASDPSDGPSSDLSA